MSLKTDVNTVLADLGTLAIQAAKQGGEDAVKLAQRAADLTAEVIKIADPKEKLEALESIGHAMKSGLAAIANKQARALLDSVIGRSLDFAKTLLGGVLGLLK